VRLYAFLSQVLPFADAGLEKLYVYGRLLLRVLPVDRARLPAEITQQIDIDSYRVQKTGDSAIKLKLGRGELTPPGELPVHALKPDLKEALSAIIKELNERFGTDFSPGDWVFVQDLEDRLEANPALEASVRANTRDNARLTFDHVVNDTLQDMIEVNFQFYKQVNDNPEFARYLLDQLFERYLKTRRPDSAAG
jgi:type I restriction enzyme, R subunit